ncbi:MAG: tetratricopeptide repeat protein [Snowella sp.]|nr:tetratricopeptide repeat protein [Snowella sp.]
MVHPVKASPLFSGSIAHTLGRLLLWSQRPTRGLARVEFYSEFSRQVVIQKLTNELQKQGINFTEIRLPLWSSSAQVLNFLLDELEKAKSGVVSIVGFETAFNPEHLQQALGVLNFNRENFARFHGRQIWWMSQDFLNRVINFMPDLNSWFTLRLSLTELTESSPKSSENLGLVGNKFLLNPVANGSPEMGKQWQNLPNSGIAQFVGREKYLIEIEQILATDHRVVLQGMGGCGKSELALQYAWRQWHNQHYGGGICWLNAFEGDLGLQILNFAYSRLGLVIPTDGVLAERVALCWQNWPAGQVLIIIDDLRDYGIIEPYLPQINETRFQVIITTRFNYLRHTIKTINLDVLNPESAINLLNSYVTDSRIDQQLEQAKLLCRDLGYLPLALELVARLLRRQKDWTVEQIRERLAEKGLADQIFQKDPNFDAEMTAQNGVKASFDVSWEALDCNAQKLAMYLSLFALAPFSKTLIDALLSEQNPEDLEVWLTDSLVNLSLVNDLGNDWYELHPLIRVYLREKLEESPLKEEAKRAYGRVMVGIAKTIKQTLTLADIANLEPYIEHLKVAAEELNQWLEGEDLTWPFIGLGRFYQAQGLYQQAVPYREQCLTLSEQRFGKNHPDVATSLNNLALLYESQGKYGEAEPLYLRSLAIDEKVYGENHPEVATSLNNLAGLYYAQGKYAEAEPLYLRSLEIREKQLGENHPEVATSLNNLALLYKTQGKYGEAEPLYLRSLAIDEKVYGKNHPDVATDLNNLAGLYDSQGKYGEAQPLYLRSLEIREKQLGAEHPSIATSLNNLAELYRAQGKYGEAQPLYQRAIAILLATLGENHPNTQTVMENYYLMLAQLPDNELNQRFPPKTVEYIKSFRQT